MPTDAAPAHTITWVIVSYGGVEDARRLVSSLGGTAAAVAQHTRFVLACNRAGDAEQAQTRFTEEIAAEVLTVRDYPDNPGYLPALSRVVDELRPTGSVVLSNCDLLGEPDVLAKVHAAVDRFPAALALAPAIINPRGLDQNPHLLRPRPAWWLRTLALLHWWPPLADVLLLLPNGRSSLTVRQREPGQTMWAGHGSAVILTPAYLASGGRLDYPFALFGEELWIGSQVADLGGEVRYVPEVTLRHAEHATTGSGRRRGWIARVQYQGLRYWAREARRRGW